MLAQIVSPDRWLLWLGILFVLSVYYLPTGVVGRLRSLGSASPRPQAIAMRFIAALAGASACS